jgi:hypothetical protein
MEFQVKLTNPIADFGMIEDAIRAFDPAAQVDIDDPCRTLRVAASVEASELAALLRDAGCPVSPLQIVQLPSICCGGCSG